MFRTVTGLSVGALIAFGAGSIYAPEATANILDRIEDTLSQITAPDCETRPIDCLKNKETDLAKIRDRINDALSGLDVQEETATELLRQQRRLLSEAELFANEGRRLYNGNAQTVEFVGKTYSREELGGQLELLYLERERLEEVVAESQKTVDALKRAKTELLSRRSSIEATLSILPARIALAEAQAAYQGFQSDLETIDEVLASGRNSLEQSKPLLRTTSDLSQDKLSTAPENEGFEAWLREVPTQ